MKNTATNYREPHHVMLVFEAGADALQNNECVLKDRSAYYQQLKEQKKALFYGDFWNQNKEFIIVHIESAMELEEIIDNDPGLKHEIVELVRAMPFTLEESFEQAIQEQAYG
jgi:uncharacterized protein YciI